MAHNRQGLLLCCNLCSSNPELKPNRITDDEDENKSLMELRLTEPLVIANKKMRIYSSAGKLSSNALALSFPSRLINAITMRGLLSSDY
jgi:hypothetical protein